MLSTTTKPLFFITLDENEERLYKNI